MEALEREVDGAGVRAREQLGRYSWGDFHVQGAMGCDMVNRGLLVTLIAGAGAAAISGCGGNHHSQTRASITRSSTVSKASVAPQPTARGTGSRSKVPATVPPGASAGGATVAPGGSAGGALVSPSSPGTSSSSGGGGPEGSQQHQRGCGLACSQAGVGGTSPRGHGVPGCGLNCSQPEVGRISESSGHQPRPRCSDECRNGGKRSGKQPGAG